MDIRRDRPATSKRHDRSPARNPVGGPRAHPPAAPRGAALLCLAVACLVSLTGTRSTSRAAPVSQSRDDADHVVLEDFESSPVGQLPQGWDWKDKDDDRHKPYEVREEDGNKYLAARDEGESVILGKKIRWNLDEYPYVSFRWRVHEIPDGGDERYDDRVDSAAGIYFTYKKKAFGLIPLSVKYVWSSTLPVGAATRREGVGKPWQVVADSGRSGLGEWRTHVFDLRQAYRDTFGGDPPSRPLGIGILSDANSTNSRAYADYDDIRALREGDPGVTSGVTEILPAGR